MPGTSFPWLENQYVLPHFSDGALVLYFVLSCLACCCCVTPHVCGGCPDNEDEFTSLLHGLAPLDIALALFRASAMLGLAATPSVALKI